MRVALTRLAIVSAIVVLGCGDQETTDRRGYTKAPLENPGLTIEHADRHQLRQFGRPLTPEVTPIRLEDIRPTAN